MSEDSNESKAARAPVKVMACEVCQKEIPSSVLSSQEGADYVRHFCSDACLAHWREHQPAQK